MNAIGQWEGPDSGRDLNRVITHVTCNAKGVKWRRKVTELFIEIAIHNSFILRKNINNINIDQLQFPKNIINSFIMFHMTRHQTH